MLQTIYKDPGRIARHLMVQLAITFYLVGCSEGGGGGATDSVLAITPINDVPEVTLIVDSTTIDQNDDVLLGWNAYNVDSCTASGGWSGTKNVSGQQTINALTANSTFTITCTGDAESVSDSVNVTVVGAPAAPTVGLSASPTNLPFSGSTTLTWSSANASSCSASGGWTGSQNTSGMKTINALTADTSFSLSCNGPGGSVNDTVSVTVTAPPPALSFSASPTTIVQNGTTTLTWNSSDATGCTASGDWSGPKAVSGSQLVPNLAIDSQFNLVCNGPGGSVNDTVSVTVTAPPPALSFSASPTTIVQNGTTTLTWNSSDATGCTASGDWSGPKAVSGSQLVPNLAIDSQFNLVCNGPGGSVNDTAVVTVNDTGMPALSLPANIVVNIASGNSVAITDPQIVSFLAGATATDDVDGSVLVTNNAPGSFPVGVTIVTFSFTDVAGNTASDTATVTVSDTGLPTVTAPPDLALSVASGSNILATESSIATFLSSATAQDDVDNDGTLTNSVTNNAPGSFSVGVTIVTFSVTDVAGNTGTASAVIAISDAGAPTVTPPPDLALSVASGSSILATDEPLIATFLSSATAQDDIDLSVPVINNAPGSYPVGVTTVTFSATDSSGNTGVATAVVTVNDTGMPALSLAANIVVNIASGNSVAITDPQIVSFLAGATATDDVDGSLTVTNDAPAVLPIGVTTVTFSATDAAGNSVSATAVVTVTVTAPPPALSFSASPTTIDQNGSTTLAWDSSDATGCTASGDWSGSKAVSGSQLVSGLVIDSQFSLVCNGPGGSVNDTVNVSVVLNSTGTALMSWTPPTENQDNTPLTDLAGYRIYYGVSSGNYSDSIVIDNPGLTSYLIENLASATWYFSMTAVNSRDIESVNSAEVSKSIN